MAAPAPSRTFCMMSNMLIRPRSSFLNMSAVSSSKVAVWGGNDEKKLQLSVRKVPVFLTFLSFYLIHPNDRKYHIV